MEATHRPILLTGAQPTAQFQLGNYIGAISQWVRYLQTHTCYIFICDLHALTVRTEPAELRRCSLSNTALYLACGLDPAQCHIFLQSHIKGLTELAWILACLCPVGELQRMTQFKDKSARQTDGFIGAGLLYYPALMAADILLYDAQDIPVGEDQTQHIELTRELAHRFNNQYSPTFTVPTARIPQVGGRIMSLQEPGRKMSKSDPNHKGTIFLLDSPDTIRSKIRSAVTDSDHRIEASPEKPGVTNLLHILSSLSGTSISELEMQFASHHGYQGFKEEVVRCVVEALEPVQDRYRHLMKDTAYLHDVLQAGAQAAQRRADRTLAKVYRKVGLLLPEKNRSAT